MTPPSPPTSWGNVAFVGLFCLVVAVCLHGWRGKKERLSEELASVVRRHGVPDTARHDLDEDSMAILRRYHRSAGAFLLTCLPFAVQVAGLTGCSLLRDAGYEIFPWPLLIVCLVAGHSFEVARRLRLRSIRRLLLGSPKTGVAGRSHA